MKEHLFQRRKNGTGPPTILYVLLLLQLSIACAAITDLGRSNAGVSVGSHADLIQHQLIQHRATHCIDGLRLAAAI